MGIFQRLAAEGKIKRSPKRTDINCGDCGKPLLDYELEQGHFCTRCAAIRKVKKDLEPLKDSFTPPHVESIHDNDLPF
jgi:hypothetical protein